jgi:hypothetical protein
LGSESGRQAAIRTETITLPCPQGLHSRGLIRLAYSWEPPQRNYKGAKLIAQAIKKAR